MTLDELGKLAGITVNGKRVPLQQAVRADMNLKPGTEEWFKACFSRPAAAPYTNFDGKKIALFNDNPVVGFRGRVKKNK